MSLPLDPFGRCVKRPATFDRFARVTQLGDAAIALLEERLPAREACVFLGAVLVRRLRDGGDLEELLGLRPPRGSKLTAEKIWREAGGDVIDDVGRLDEDDRQSDQVNDNSDNEP